MCLLRGTGRVRTDTCWIARWHRSPPIDRFQSKVEGTDYQRSTVTVLKLAFICCVQSAPACVPAY